MIVGVTGGQGFLGWHIRVRLHALGIETLVADRVTFGDDGNLDHFVARCDAIIHVAGVNRAESDADVREGNLTVATKLVEALNRSRRAVPIAYTNSTQIERGNVYGTAKAEASRIIGDWCKRSDAPFADLVLPHLFGEFGRENYNSVVTTFAHCLATEREAHVSRGGELELLHAQDVAQRIASWLDNPNSGQQRLSGRPISVGEVWDLLQSQHDRYCGDRTFPPLIDHFELRVFNTLRSQLYRTGYYPIQITLHSDARGAFAELGRADGTGQTSISTSFPNIQRGDHFHFDKIERFVVVSGSAEIRIRRLLTQEIQSFSVSGDHPVAIDMPPLCTHNIRNTGDHIMTTVFWAGDHFDPSNPDTYPEPVGADAA